MTALTPYRLIDYYSLYYRPIGRPKVNPVSPTITHGDVPKTRAGGTAGTVLARPDVCTYHRPYPVRGVETMPV
jgi:hypothetical protein